jgi:hypothetical protein
MEGEAGSAVLLSTRPLHSEKTEGQKSDLVEVT